MADGGNAPKIDGAFPWARAGQLLQLVDRKSQVRRSRLTDLLWRHVLGHAVQFPDLASGADAGAPRNIDNAAVGIHSHSRVRGHDAGDDVTVTGEVFDQA